MKIRSIWIAPPRASVLLALVLVFLTAGIRLGEWTLCLESDGRVHSESGGGDCAQDGRDHDDHQGDESLSSSRDAAVADCDGCLDITGRSLALRLKNESIDSSSIHILPLVSCLLPVSGPAWSAVRLTGDPESASPSRLIFRAIDTIILTC
ncbi:MAG: hypothetical protein SGI90_16780 [Candidatus Eisenbacteria bacterium]|nr:hypothetical protein [Candidatus Eisenbacteria bacterium]